MMEEFRAGGYFELGGVGEVHEVAADDCQAGAGVGPLRASLEFGQEERREEECAEDVDCEGVLHLAVLGVVFRRQHPGVQDRCVQPLER